MSEGYDEEVVEWLKRSREQVGELEPVYCTTDGEVIDGRHRLKAYPGWKSVTIEAVGSKKIVERIHRNIHRRMSRQELKEAIIQLALSFEKEGVAKANLIDRMKEVLPFSEDYIRSLLPAKFKREYRKPSIPAVKVLTEKEKPEHVEREAPKEEKSLICPVCQSRLILKGDLLFPATT